MKVLLAVFAILAVAFNSVNAETDYRRLALVIKTSISNLIFFLNKASEKIEVVNDFLQATVNITDFKIASNPQIIELQLSFKTHEFNKGIVNCINGFKITSENLLLELQNALLDSVKQHLNDYRVALYNIRGDLTAITLNLEGALLEKELKSCEDAPKTCKIITDYPETVTRHNKYINSVQNEAEGLIASVLETEILPKVADKINNEIYKPAKECISKLS